MGWLCYDTLRLEGIRRFQGIQRRLHKDCGAFVEDGVIQHEPGVVDGVELAVLQHGGIQQEVGAGDLFEEKSRVLAAHEGVLHDDDLILWENFSGGFEEAGGDRFVVDDGWVGIIKAELIVSTEAFDEGVYDFFNAFQDKGSGVKAQGADGAQHFRAVRDDVVGAAAGAEAGYGDDGGACGVDFTADDALEGHNNVGCYGDGIHGFVGR